MRRLKRCTAFLQSSRDCFRGNRAWPTRANFARIKSRGGSVEWAGCLRARRCSANSDGIRSRLVEAENVGVACGDLAQFNIARRGDIRVMLRARRPLPLLSCNGTKTQECEYYGYSQCHDRFGRESHWDYVFGSDAFRRNSSHPPPELNEVIL
jgi:hypothetical protein